MDARLIRRVKPRQEFDRAVKLQSRDGHGDWQSVVGAVRTSDSHKISLVRCTLARHVSRALFVCGPLMARQPESNARPVHPVLPALTSQRPPPPPHFETGTRFINAATAAPRFPMRGVVLLPAANWGPVVQRPR